MLLLLYLRIEMRTIKYFDNGTTSRWFGFVEDFYIEMDSRWLGTSRETNARCQIHFVSWTQL